MGEGEPERERSGEGEPERECRGELETVGEGKAEGECSGVPEEDGLSVEVEQLLAWEEGVVDCEGVGALVGVRVLLCSAEGEVEGEGEKVPNGFTEPKKNPATEPE